MTEFKAKCLALLDEIGKEGGTITVTKRGIAIAIVGQARQRRGPSTEGILAGKVQISDEELMADRSGTWGALDRHGA